MLEFSRNTFKNGKKNAIHIEGRTAFHNSANCTDYQLRQVSAHMMGLDGFSEAEFEKQVEGVTVFPDGSLEYSFYGGRKERWQRA